MIRMVTSDRGTVTVDEEAVRPIAAPDAAVTVVDGEGVRPGRHVYEGTHHYLAYSPVRGHEVAGPVVGVCGLVAAPLLADASLSRRPSRAGVASPADGAARTFAARRTEQRDPSARHDGLWWRRP